MRTLAELEEAVEFSRDEIEAWVKEDGEDARALEREE
jgi:hypothetical protein